MTTVRIVKNVVVMFEAEEEKSSVVHGWQRGRKTRRWGRVIISPLEHDGPTATWSSHLISIFPLQACRVPGLACCCLVHPCCGRGLRVYFDE